MSDQGATGDRERGPVAPTPFMDVAAAAVLGIFLGLLVGFSGSPVVSSVVTALVALLAGLFGLSEKLSPGLSSSTARRIVSFGLAATIATPIAIYARTHELLAPSVTQEKAMLAELGISGGKDQTEMLRFLHFGILPTGVTAVPKESPAGAVVTSVHGILFSAPASFCTSFLQLSTASQSDVLGLFDQQSAELRNIAGIIRGLPNDQRQQALDSGRLYLCGVR